MTWPQLFCKWFPELIFLSLEKALLFFFQFELASVSTESTTLVYYIAAPTVTKLPSFTKASKDGLGSVVQPDLIVLRQITHFQFLETYLSSFLIRRRSNTDFSCAKCNTFWVRRLSSIITKYFKDVLALTAWDLRMSVILKSLAITRLSSPQITRWCVRSPSPCSSVGRGGLQQWSVSSFWTTYQHTCPQAAMVVCFCTVRRYLAIPGKTCLLVLAVFKINRL